MKNIIIQNLIIFISILVFLLLLIKGIQIAVKKIFFDKNQKKPIFIFGNIFFMLIGFAGMFFTGEGILSESNSGYYGPVALVFQVPILLAFFALIFFGIKNLLKLNKKTTSNEDKNSQVN